MTDAKTETHRFEAEVGRLLDLMVNALYSQRDVFLRELISNAADACDRLRYAAIDRPELLGDDPDPAITLTLDRKAKTLTVEDNGIGMTREELAKELGTIARSGTRAFLDRVAGGGAEKKDVNLIGQFGVGFYSAFMVAGKVVVDSVAAGGGGGWTWSSDGKGSFEIGPSGRTGRGTAIRLHLRADAKEYLEPERVRGVVRTWSDHVAVPVRLRVDPEAAPETLNTASALWTRPKGEIRPEQYLSLYRDVGHALDEPWITLHNRAEGKLSYVTLLFVPTERPFDLFDPERRPNLRLFVKRVFITDRTDALVPRWLRFVRGVVDSEDLPLNVSREMLQHDPRVARLRRSITGRVLKALADRAEKEPDAYARFWERFGPVLKEGLYEDEEWRKELLALARFRSSERDGLVGLDEYVGRMKEGQEEIYYAAGEDPEQLRNSPQVEGFRARGVEVLLFSDSVDDFWVGRVGEHDGKRFRSVTQGTIDLAAFEKDDGKGKGEKGKDGADDPGLEDLLGRIRAALGDEVADVVRSGRLTESPACLVAPESGMDLQVERLLQRHGQIGEASRKVLEINPGSGFVRALAADGVGEQDFDDAVRILLDQARMLAGERVPDLAAFARRMNRLVGRGLAPTA